MAPRSALAPAAGFKSSGFSLPGCLGLGQLHVEVSGEVTAGQRYVIAGWEIECEGREHFVGTAQYDEASNLVASARATWIEVPAQQ